MTSKPPRVLLNRIGISGHIFDTNFIKIIENVFCKKLKNLFLLLSKQWLLLNIICSLAYILTQNTRSMRIWHNVGGLDAKMLKMVFVVHYYIKNICKEHIFVEWVVFQIAEDLKAFFDIIKTVKAFFVHKLQKRFLGF